MSLILMDLKPSEFMEEIELFKKQSRFNLKVAEASFERELDLLNTFKDKARKMKYYEEEVEKRISELEKKNAELSYDVALLENFLMLYLEDEMKEESVISTAIRLLKEAYVPKEDVK